jgi:hypothetical protein
MVACCDGLTAGTEGWQQQHGTYVVCVPPQPPCAWIAMSAMLTASATDRGRLLFHSSNFGRLCWGVTFASWDLSQLKSNIALLRFYESDVTKIGIDTKLLPCKIDASCRQNIR